VTAELDNSQQRQYAQKGVGEDGKPPAPNAAAQNARRRRPRIVFDAILVVGVTTLLIAGILYWREAPIRRAQKYLEQGQTSKALAWSEYYLYFHPNDSRGLSIKAQALVGVGRPAEAIEIFDRVHVATINDTYILARALMMQEQWSRALPYLIRVLELNPNHPDALYEVTTCRLRLNFLNEALETAERYSKLPGCEARGNLLMAIIQGDQGNYKGSIRAYEEAIRLSPNGDDWQMSSEEVFSQYAAMLMKAGRPEDAVKVLAKCKPTPAIYAALGDAYRQVGDLENAEKTWKKALEMEPANMFAREGLASVVLQRNDPQEAINILTPFKSAVNLKASQAYLLQMAYARVDAKEAEKWKQVTLTLRQRSQRESQYERALLTAPRSPAAMVIRAHRFASVGNYEQALDIAEELAEKVPKDPLVKDLLTAIRNKTELPSLDRLPINVPAGGDESTNDNTGHRSEIGAPSALAPKQ